MPDEIKNVVSYLEHLADLEEIRQRGINRRTGVYKDMANASITLARHGSEQRQLALLAAVDEILHGAYLVSWPKA